jgi:hypothetical protein
VRFDIANAETPIGVAAKGGKATVAEAVVIRWELSQEGQRVEKRAHRRIGSREFKRAETLDLGH